jgi:hypothetical protein
MLEQRPPRVRRTFDIEIGQSWPNTSHAAMPRLCDVLAKTYVFCIVITDRESQSERFEPKASDLNSSHNKRHGLVGIPKLSIGQPPLAEDEPATTKPRATLLHSSVAN